MANEARPSRGVFISYRRNDSAPFAGRIFDYLVEAFSESQVFMDVDSIRPGVDFVDSIEQAVHSSGESPGKIGHGYERNLDVGQF